MFSLRKPAPAVVERFLLRQHDAQLSYEHVGQTQQSDYPSGFVFDHRRTSLGRGEECFERAKAALAAWRHFELGWVAINEPLPPIEVGRNVAITIHTFGVWALAATRIVYTIDQPTRFGFAYGTLKDHLESGEERFLVEWTGDDQVYYDISAFSRPHHALLWLGYPFTRRQQKRFARESCACMKRAAA